MLRRTFVAASTAGVTASLAQSGDASAGGAGRSRALALPPLDATIGPRIIPANRERVAQVLAAHGLDGFVAARPHNVYYFTNADPVLTAFKAEYSAFAVVSARPDAPYVYVGSSGSTWELGRDGRQKPDAVVVFTGARNWQDYVGAGPERMQVEPAAYRGEVKTAVATEASLTPQEQRWRTAQDTYPAQAAPSAAWAVVRALKEAGITRGVIGTDDMRVAYLLSSIGYEAVTVMAADNVMRQVRQVKTDHEVALIRIAQAATQAAIMASARALEVGMTYDDFRRQFFTEAQARDCEPGFVLLGVTQGMLPDPVVTKGRCYMIDSSASYRHYMGDFARTVTIGEPSKLALQRFKAQQIGRQAAMDMIRPGVMRSQVEQVARSEMIKAGMPEALVPAITLHCVGLEHSDEPNRFDSPYGPRLDYALQPNMTLTLDLPFMEIGWGAGHNEDMIRITATGLEFLNDTGEPLIVV